MELKRPPHSKPDPRPMRLVLGTTALATLSATIGAIVATPPAVQLTAGSPASAPPATPVAVERAVVYVQLTPGETAPPGATVIDAAAPKPITVVTVVPAPAQRPVIIRTTQSGKVIK